jgi:hypothetical protein
MVQAADPDPLQDFCVADLSQALHGSMGFLARIAQMLRPKTFSSRASAPLVRSSNLTSGSGMKCFFYASLDDIPLLIVRSWKA